MQTAPLESAEQAENSVLIVHLKNIYTVLEIDVLPGKGQ